MDLVNVHAAVHMLSAEELLMGAAATYEISVPVSILNPGKEKEFEGDEETRVVQIRPLTVGVFQLIMKAAKNDPGLIPLLMVKESLNKPQMSLDQVRKMHLGLVEFLVDHIKRISGLDKKKRN